MQPSAVMVDDRERQERWAHRLRQARIPTRYLGCRIEDLTQTDGNRLALEVARAFLCEEQRRKRGLVFTGPTGVGKTHLAAALAQAHIGMGWTVRYWIVRDLFRDLKRLYDGAHTVRDEEVLLRGLAEADLLVLDDLGAERGTEWERSVLLDVIDRCWNERTTLLVTTNLTPEKLDATLDARVVSRLIGLCRILRLDGQDFRVTRK